MNMILPTPKPTKKLGPIRWGTFCDNGIWRRRRRKSVKILICKSQLPMYMY